MEFPELNSWIGGASEPSAEALPAAQDLHDPNTGERFAENRSASAEQLDRAIAAATAAHEDGRWSGLAPRGARRCSDDSPRSSTASPSAWRGSTPSIPAYRSP